MGTKSYNKKIIGAAYVAMGPSIGPCIIGAAIFDSQWEVDFKKIPQYRDVGLTTEKVNDICNSMDDLRRIPLFVKKEEKELSGQDILEFQASCIKEAMPRIGKHQVEKIYFNSVGALKSQGDKLVKCFEEYRLPQRVFHKESAPEENPFLNALKWKLKLKRFCWLEEYLNTSCCRKHPRRKLKDYVETKDIKTDIFYGASRESRKFVLNYYKSHKKPPPAFRVERNWELLLRLISWEAVKIPEEARRAIQEPMVQEYLRYNSDAFGEDVSALQPKPRLLTGEPDFIFKDKEGKEVIVEVEPPATLRKGAEQLLRYKISFLLQEEKSYKEEYPRLLLITWDKRQVDKVYKKYRNLWNVECRAIDPDEVILWEKG